MSIKNTKKEKQIIQPLPLSFKEAVRAVFGSPKSTKPPKIKANKKHMH